MTHLSSALGVSEASLFTQVTLLWSSGAAPGGDVDLGFRPGGRGTGVARDQHAVDLPGHVALEAADDLSLALALRGATRATYSLVRRSRRIRARQIMYSARLASLLPPRLRRCLTIYRRGSRTSSGGTASTIG